MRHQDWYPVRIGDQIVWLRNHKIKLAAYAGLLDLDPDDVTARSLDIDNIIYALEGYRGGVGTFTDAAYQRIEDALGNTALEGSIAWLTFSAPAGAPAAVGYGALRRIFDYINDTIKKAGAYDRAIGLELGCEASEQAEPSPTIEPEFQLRETTGGKLEVVWTKDVFDGVMLEFDLGAAGMKTATDLRPNYTLNWLPTGTDPVRIKVRLRYLYKGEEFGNWSAWKPWLLEA